MLKRCLSLKTLNSTMDYYLENSEGEMRWSDVYIYENIFQYNSAYNRRSYLSKDGFFDDTAIPIRVNKNEICRSFSNSKYEKDRKNRLALIKKCIEKIKKEYRIPSLYLWSTDDFLSTENESIMTGELVFGPFSGLKIKSYKCFNPKKLNDNYYK